MRQLLFGRTTPKANSHNLSDTVGLEHVGVERGLKSEFAAKKETVNRYIFKVVIYEKKKAKKIL